MKAKILNYILAVVLLLLVVKLARKEKPANQVIINRVQAETNDDSEVLIIESTHQARVWLTVAESKRLIAKGLRNYPPIKERLKNGYLLITEGTTNTYVAEELN